MRIGIDARFYGLQHAGLGRYTKNLVSELELLDRENEYVIFLNAKNYSHYQPKNPNFTKAKLYGHPYSIVSQFIDWIPLYRCKLDIMHFTHFSHPVLYAKKFVVTIHDLIKNQFYDKGASTRSRVGYSIKHKGYELVMNRAVKRAAVIITPTNFVKDELQKMYRLQDSRIVSIYEGADQKFTSEKPDETISNEVVERYGLRKPYLLYVGNVYPYKNVSILLNVIEWLGNKKTDVMLGIVCARSVFYDRLKSEIKQKQLSDSVKMLGFVPDDELAILYKNAIAYITATLSEGFGITGIEAMSAGCPVLASDKTCLPEVYGDAARYFNPLEVGEISTAVLEILNDDELRNNLIRKGIKQASGYSWGKMAREINSVYRQVLQQ